LQHGIHKETIGSKMSVTVKLIIVNTDPKTSPVEFQKSYFELMYPLIVKSKYPSKNTPSMKLKNIPYFKNI